MATIQFERRPGYLTYSDPPIRFEGEVVILIDGKPLGDLVKGAEPESAGRYIGLADSDLPSGYFLAQTDGYAWATFADKQVGRTLLLRCSCGELGCWPLSAIITVEDESVTWSNFRQGHRKQWRYEALGDGGKLVFDREYCEIALEAAGFTVPQ